MARRGSQPPRERYQARVNLHDGMGDLWEYVISHPERSRVHALIVAATIGARIARGAGEGVIARVGAAPGAAEPVPRSTAPATPHEAAPGPRSLDPVDATLVSAGLTGWDLSSAFDALAPMQ